MWIFFTPPIHTNLLTKPCGRNLGCSRRIDDRNITRVYWNTMVILLLKSLCHLYELQCGARVISLPVWAMLLSGFYEVPVEVGVERNGETRLYVLCVCVIFCNSSLQFPFFLTTIFHCIFLRCSDRRRKKDLKVQNAF